MSIYFASDRHSQLKDAMIGAGFEKDRVFDSTGHTRLSGGRFTLRG